jgi:hypothetical protein
MRPHTGSQEADPDGQGAVASVRRSASYQRHSLTLNLFGVFHQYFVEHEGEDEASCKQSGVEASSHHVCFEQRPCTIFQGCCVQREASINEEKKDGKGHVGWLDLLGKESAAMECGRLAWAVHLLALGFTASWTS